MPIALPPLLQERKQNSELRIQELKQRVGQLGCLKAAGDLSIYVTGSYGRLEAHAASDLDLFFVLDRPTPIERQTKTLIDADLIRLAAEMGFPPFSNDVQYLEIHLLNDMLEKLGGSEDDFKNFFTARLLLLLESRPIYGQEIYNQILTKITEAYFRDYHDHTEGFRPLFLVNDILRFWKTLCLNYENRRNRSTERAQKNKHHLRNLKLKFSRLLICFSTIIPLSAVKESTPSDVLELTALPPVDRLSRIANSGEQQQALGRILELYSDFLATVARADIQDWIGDRGNRSSMFKKAERFSAEMFDFLKSSVADPNDLRLLII